MKNSKPIKQLALALAQATYTPIPYFLSVTLDELAEYAEMASKKPCGVTALENHDNKNRKRKHYK